MKKLFVLLFAVVVSVGVKAQSGTDPVIFEINGKPVYKSQFMQDFLRSIGQDPSASPTACTYEKRQALEEYVDLYVNFHAKLADAYAQGLDTLPSLVKELAGYRKELAAPYLIDSVTLDRILHEAYERNHYVLHAAHILVRVSDIASPEDTLEAYNKIMNYYNRAMAGEDFFSLAIEENTYYCNKEMLSPDDPARRDNGDLGNFTVFDMIYPFENAVFSLKEGEISRPIRTQYGYHIIKLFTKNNFFGRVTFQHIWCAPGENPTLSEGRIQEAYNMINEGRDFSIICRNYSDDNSTSQNGGLLSDMSYTQIPPEYITILSRLKEGEMSQPFVTQYGFHIVRLIHRDTIPGFDDMVPYYKQRMVRDLRNSEPRSSFVAQCKEKYNFVDFTTCFTKPSRRGKNVVALASLDNAKAAVNDSVFRRRWHFGESMVTDTRPLFNLDGKDYYTADFLKYIEANQKILPASVSDVNMYVENKYQDFINDIVFNYADSRLEVEYPEFAAVMEEYRNGLMIFAYNDLMIWSQAIDDTTGFKAFYNVMSQQKDIDNEADAPYFFGERANVRVLTVDDSSFISPAKAAKLMVKAEKKGWVVVQLTDALNEKIRDNGTFRVEESVIEKDNQSLLKPNQWRVGLHETALPKGYRLVYVEKLLDPSLKSIKEARGYYVNDYQNYIEKQLIERLRVKYNVVIHQDVIDEITY